MPKINPYQQKIANVGPIADTHRATAETFGGDGGFGDLGKSVEKFGTDVQDRLDRDSVFDAETANAKEATDLEKVKAQMQENAPAGGKGYTEQMTVELDKRKQRILDGYQGTSKGRATLELRLGALYGDAQRDAIHFEAQSRGKQERINLDDQFNEFSNGVRANPNLLPKYLDLQNNLVASSRLDGTSKLQLGKDMSMKLYDSYLDGQVTAFETSNKTQVGQIDKLINTIKAEGSDYRANNTKEGFDNGLSRLQRLKETVVKKHEEIAGLQFDEAQDQKENTGTNADKYKGMTHAWIDQTFSNETTRYRAHKRLDSANAVAEKVNLVRGASDEKIMDLLVKSDPNNPGSGLGKSENFHRDYNSYEALKKAVLQRESQWKNDQLGYTMEVNPAVKSSYEAFQKNPTPSTAAQFADMARIAQKELSPTSIPSLIPAAEIGRFKTQMEAISTDPRGAKQATDLLQQEQMKWGKNWPYVVRDLVKGKALNDSQYVAASMVDDPNHKGLADDIVRSGAMTDKEITEALPSGNFKGISDNARVQAQSALGSFRNTFPQNVQGYRTYKAYEDTLTKLILYKSAISSKDQTGLAKDLAGQIVNNKYQFNETYRIPKVIDGRPIEPTTIENGVENLRNKLDKMNVIPVEDSAGLRPEDAKARYISAVKRHGMFLTLGDESGVRLVDEKGADVYVQGEKGGRKQLSWTWADLKAEGVSLPEGRVSFIKHGGEK